jgi:hypothetical protein
MILSCNKYQNGLDTETDQLVICCNKTQNWRDGDGGNMVSGLTHLVFSLSPWRTLFNPRALHVQFVVGKAELQQIFFWYISFHLYTFFWVFPRRQNELTPGKPGKYPKESIQDSEHGENLKSSFHLSVLFHQCCIHINSPVINFIYFWPLTEYLYGTFPTIW